MQDIVLARGTMQYWQPSFGSKSGPGRQVLADFSTKIGPPRPVLDFGVIGRPINLTLLVAS